MPLTTNESLHAAYLDLLGPESVFDYLEILGDHLSACVDALHPLADQWYRAGARGDYLLVALRMDRQAGDQDRVEWVQPVPLPEVLGCAASDVDQNEISAAARVLLRRVDVDVVATLTPATTRILESTKGSEIHGVSIEFLTPSVVACAFFPSAAPGKQLMALRELRSTPRFTHCVNVVEFIPEERLKGGKLSLPQMRLLKWRARDGR